MLDNITLLLAASVTNFLLAASQVAFRKPADALDPARTWFRGKLLLGIAEALYLLGGSSPAFLRTTLPNVIGAAGLGFEAVAIWEILGFARARRPVAWACGGLTLYQLLLQLPPLSSPVRLGFVCLGILLEFAILAAAYVQGWRGRSPLVRSLAAANLVLVAAYAVRVAEAFSAGPNYTLTTRAWGQTLAFAVLFLATQVNGFGFILALKERADADLERLATLDTLTETLNRRGFSDLAAKLAGMAERFGQPLSVLHCDIDRFKQVNDRSGHAFGDEILRRLAQMMREQLRSTDLIGRYGGDEFVVLLPHTAMAGALKVAANLNRRFAEESLRPGGDGIRISLSVGVAERRPQESFQAMIDRADQALYRAKASGRDRVEADPPAAP